MCIQKPIICIATFITITIASSDAADQLVASVAEVTLSAQSDSQQLVISSVSNKVPTDVTRTVHIETNPPGIVHVSNTGYITPLANGSTTIIATSKDDATVSIPTTVRTLETLRAVSFRNDVVPQLTKSGCNGGGCHGTPKGKNNFRLSLLGFEPEKDFEFLTRESRGRRIFPAAPERSLLLQKACGELPHGGGKRMDNSSESYRLLTRWIAEGMSFGPENDPTVTHITVFPESRVVQRGQSQQLTVTAFFDDGTTRDITRVAEFKANQPEMCEVDHQGLVTMKELTGTSSVMVRFQEHVGAFMSTIPLGAPTPHFPASDSFIDQHIFTKLETLGLPPSEQCDDATFLRRVTLDVAGRIPTLAETDAFLKSSDSDKRSRTIDRLLNSNGYADWFANKWAGLLRNKAGGNLEQVARETYGFHAWIRDALRANRPFDQFATDIITARGKAGTNPAVSWYRAVSDTNERLADIAQVFLGVRIQCAQCHHHPYEKWSQNDYHGFAAFFSTLDRKETRKLPEDSVLYHKRILAVARNPDTNEELRPTPLDGQPLDIPASRDPRIDLAEWMTSPSNPFFAKVLVNRYWKHFFGRGLVEPEDDIRVTNPATHPELLDELAESFKSSGYDLKHLCRTICNSQTYQRSSVPNEHNGNDEQNYARYYPRRLPAEVMLDSINDVAGARNNFNKQPVGVRATALPDDSVNNESFFLRVFGRPQMDTACECERSADADLAQSLTLLNSDTMHQILTSPGGTADTFAHEKERDDVARIEELYLHALSRVPTAQEQQIALNHLTKKQATSAADPAALSPEQASKEAWQDIVWVVVNTKEFLFNH